MRLVQQLEGAYVRRMRRAVPKPGRPCTICGQAKRVRIEATVTAGTSMTLGGSVGSAGVPPVFTTCFGPRTAAAGLVGTIWPVISQLNIIRTAAGRPVS